MPTRRRRPASIAPNGATDGFTMVELVVALAMLGILAAIAAPRFFEASGFQASLFLDQTRAAMRYAQKLAVGSGCNVELSFAASSITLKQQPSCAGASYTQNVVHPGTGAASYAETAPGGVALSSSVDPLRFDALGRATNSSGTVTGATVTVGSGSITVVGETGYVY